MKSHFRFILGMFVLLGPVNTFAGQMNSGSYPTGSTECSKRFKEVEEKRKSFASGSQSSSNAAATAGTVRN